MKELGDALSTLLARVAGFFDILDLSFLVAGTLNLAGLYLMLVAAQVPLPPGGWFEVPLVLVVIYGVGLCAFSAGRWLRAWLNRRWLDPHRTLDVEHAIPQLIEAHGLDQDLRFQPYLRPASGSALTGFDATASLRRPWRLYTRLWAELRHDPSRGPSLHLALRYWVMTATCDGLAATASLWALGVLGLLLSGFGPLRQHWVWVVLGAVVLGWVAYLMVLEANRYLRSQHEELVASLAASTARAAPVPKPGDSTPEG